MAGSITPERLAEAFTWLGRDLAIRGAFVEIAVYGGSALLMQFAWRRSTEDVVDDARRLAEHLRVISEDELLDLYRSIYDDEPSPAARARFATVLEH